MLRIRLLLVLLLPNLFDATLENNVSSQCLTDIKELLSELNSHTPKPYAVMMYDAMGKIGSGVLKWHTQWLGSLSECLAADSGTFQGQYCKLSIKQEPNACPRTAADGYSRSSVSASTLLKETNACPRTSADGYSRSSVSFSTFLKENYVYNIGICVPNSCHSEDITALARSGTFTSLLMSLTSQFIRASSIISATETECAENLFPIDTFTSICLFCSALFIVLPITATIYVGIIEWKNTRSVMPSDTTSPSSMHYGSVSSNKNDGSERKRENLSTTKADLSINTNDKPKSKTCSVDGILKMFSLQQNLPAVLSMERPPGMASAIERHPSAQSSVSNQYTHKSNDCHHLSGLMSAKTLLNIKKKSNDRLTLRGVLKYIYNRVVRIQPLHLYIIVTYVGLCSLITWGSSWNYLKSEFTNCRTSPWLNALLINNFVEFSNSCAPWTWYLAADFQFYLTTPLLIFVYIKSKPAMFTLVGVLFLVLFVASSIFSYHYHLPLMIDGFTHPSELYKEIFYLRPYFRYGPFLLGILLGVFLFQREEPVIRNTKQALLGWVCSLCVMVLVIALPFVLYDSDSSNSIAVAIYHSLFRTLWVACIGWIIVVCEQGYGGIINKILSWDIWNFLSKITYAGYLVHYMLIMAYVAAQETPPHFSLMSTFYLVCGISVTTVIPVLALTVLVERPFQKFLQW